MFFAISSKRDSYRILRLSRRQYARLDASRASFLPVGRINESCTLDVFSVPYFTFSDRKRAARNKKYYPIDTGLRRMAVTRTGADRGKLLECAVHLELRRRGLKPAYWRGEVDFVVTIDRGIVPIQVSWERPTDRHHRALEEFYETFPQAREALLVGPAEFEADALAELAPAL